MAFRKKDVDTLLAKCGRMCCICNKLHSLHIHHIQPLADGGTNDIDNGIPLCPDCHADVHDRTSTGRLTRGYSRDELNCHKKRTIKLASQGIIQSPADIDNVINDCFCSERHKKVAAISILPSLYFRDDASSRRVSSALSTLLKIEHCDYATRNTLEALQQIIDSLDAIDADGPFEVIDDWHNCQLSGIVIRNTYLRNITLDKSWLIGAIFDGVAFRCVDMTDTRMDRAQFLNCYLDRAELYSADLEDVAFRRTHLVNSNFMRANLWGCDFSGVASMSGCNLSLSKVFVHRSKPTVSTKPPLGITSDEFVSSISSPEITYRA